MNASTSTKDTRIAAALGTLGFPVRPEVVYDEKTGDSYTRFHVGLTSTIPTIKETSLKFKSLLKSKSLLPEHPLLDCLRAFHNRKLLIQSLKKGSVCRVDSVAGGNRTVMVAAPGLAGAQGSKKMMATTDLKVVAAMGIIGVEPLVIEDTPRGAKFFLPEFGMMLKGKSHNAIELLRDFRDGRLAKTSPDHPFLYAMMALNNYTSLLSAVDQQVELVLLRKPKSKLAAYVRANASDKAFDRVKEHFGV